MKHHSFYFSKIKIIFLFFFIIDYFTKNVNSLENEFSRNKENLKALNIKNINIAVIGSGISGCSVVYYLNKLFEDQKDKYNLNITIFEKNSKLGGNVRSHKFQGKNIELGNTFIFEWQKNMKNILKDFSLNMEKYNQSSSIGIFNGEEFLINEKNKDYINKLKELFPEDMNKLLKLLSKFYTSLEKLYEKYNNFERKFEKITDLTKEIENDFGNSFNLLNDRTDSYLNNLDFKFGFIDQVIRSFLFSYRMQNTDTHIFSGLLTLLSHFNTKYSVKEGLSVLLENLLYSHQKYSKKNVFLNLDSKVTKIARNNTLENENLENGSKKYSLTIYNKEKNYVKEYSNFDLVIVSHSLKKGDVNIFDSDFNDEKKLRNLKEEVNFNKIYSHILIGNLNPKFFKLDRENMKSSKTKENEIDIFKEESLNEKIPDFILINDNQSFDLISLIYPVCKNCLINRYYETNHLKYSTIYKIYSKTKVLDGDLINKLFLSKGIYFGNRGFLHSSIKNIPSDVNSNRKSLENTNYPDVVLVNKGIYYNSALEYLNSNMEFQLISSKNIANLIFLDNKKNDFDIISSEF